VSEFAHYHSDIGDHVHDIGLVGDEDDKHTEPIVGFDYHAVDDALGNTQEYDNVPQMFVELQQTTRDIIGIYFACVHLGWHDETLRARLKSIFDLIRPYIEELEG
jgi:hypothetical protein